MSISAANPAGPPHVSLCTVDLANERAPKRDGGGELHPSCDGHASLERAPITVAFRSQGAHEDFVLKSVCRFVSRLCSGTASGLFMRPAAARSFCFGCAALRITVSLQILFAKSVEKISPEPP